MGTSNTRIGGSVLVGDDLGQVILHIFGNPCLTALPAGKPMNLQGRKDKKFSLGRRRSRTQETSCCRRNIVLKSIIIASRGD